ncbi:MAG: acetoacetate--CoA ligase [Pseudomonadota bacterium]
MNEPTALWTPEDASAGDTLMHDFARLAEQTTGQTFPQYADLHRWSVEQPGKFWSLAWSFCGLQGKPGDVDYVGDQSIRNCRFFPEARLNVVDSFLKNADDREAIVFIGEDGRRSVCTRAELKVEVAELAEAIRRQGIEKDDHVVGFVPNMPQTVAAMLATVSLGAVWSSCAPESGVDVVVDRFGQLDPKLMFAADGYHYAGKTFDTLPTVQAVCERIPSIEKVVVWPYAHDAGNLSDRTVAYDAFRISDAPELDAESVGFSHPMYVMFSSGTTGKPKCIEHSGGGTLLRLMVEQQIHSDVRPGDRLLYYSTCNWMMWNWQVAALASEATIVIYDGNPMFPDVSRLFQIAESERLNQLGVSAKFIDAVAKAGYRPAEHHDLSNLRTVFSTGSPLSPDGFHHVYDDWASDIYLASICGGTDILGAFIGGCPTLPVYPGEITCALLGMDVSVFNSDGDEIADSPGELVCRNAHPSMPTRFLGDEDGQRYHSAYFDKFDNVWCQGDFTIRTGRNSFVVLGRSDATLNPGGVRIGTAEIYRQLDRIDAVTDSVVVGQQFDSDTRVVLFVVLADDQNLDDDLVKRIKIDIRKNASPRHVPAKIIAVPDVPRTKSGKIAELAVRDVVNQQPVRNISGLANPDALDHFKNQPELDT